VIRFPRYEINAALFIGSFDPFQMTHLATALRFLASDSAEAPVVFVVPEGHDNPSKPRKSDYRYRFDLLSMQVADVFDPLIVPLDIGEGADTIEIVRRFIAMFPGAKVSMTHLLGSDTLPFAAAMLPEDLRAWRDESERRRVDFSYTAFVVTREGSPVSVPDVEAIRRCGMPVHVDDEPIGTPSSTDFRENRTFSIVFPTESVIRHVEVLFRFNLNKPWSACGLDDGPASSV
jgi:nicotinic acid mononucleotide adenylyltransferase